MPALELDEEQLAKVIVAIDRQSAKRVEVTFFVIAAPLDTRLTAALPCRQGSLR
jgi:hypothetical protein